MCDRRSYSAARCVRDHAQGVTRAGKISAVGNTVLVIGAGGAVGGAVAAAFEDAGWRGLRGGRGSGADVRLDLDAPSRLPETDIVVNTVPHPGLAAERLVLGSG